MPGIIGIADDRGNDSVEDLIQRMLHTAYTDSSYVCESVSSPQDGVGFGRVSLGFVNTHPQPARVTLADGELLAVMDGELLASCRRRLELDAELPDDAHARVLLEGYLRHGPDFLRHLEGSFAAAVWDGRRRQLILCNDRFGTRPLYYALEQGRLVFGSTVRAVLEGRQESTTANPRGLAQFFTFGHYLRDDTSLSGIRLLPAASLLTYDVDSQQSAVRVHWDTTAAPSGLPTARGGWLEAIDDAFVKAVAQRSAETEGLGLSLSGGMDARTLLGVLDTDHIPLKTVCLGMPGSRDHRSSELLAEAVGVPHVNHVLGEDFLGSFRRHLIDMVRLTDGQYLCQCIVMPTLPLYQRLGIKVLLRGHAGELMHMHKAYNYSLNQTALALGSEQDLEDWLFSRLQSYMLDGVTQPLFPAPLQEQLSDLARQSLREDLAELRNVEPISQRVWHLFVRQRLRRETTLSMVEFRSVVEPRLPYLDRRLVELLMAAPPDLKMGDEIQTYMLKKHRPRFLKITNVNTGTYVGAPLWRKTLASLHLRICAKLGLPGFQPYERLGLWLRRELAPLVRELLLSDQCLERGVFDADGLRAVVDGHLERGRNHTYLILALMIHEMGQRYLNDEPGFDETGAAPALASAGAAERN